MAVATVNKKIGDEDFWVFYDANDKLPGSRFSPLLASKDRLFLVSSPGNQVSLSFLSFSLLFFHSSASPMEVPEVGGGFHGVEVLKVHPWWTFVIADANLSITLSTCLQVDVSALEGKVVGLYFSANWYPKCQQFTQVLASVYTHLNERGTPFEIVFVSADEDLEAFDSYRTTMPWLAIPFSNLDLKKNLNRTYDIEGIPSLIILQPGDEEDAWVRYDGVDLIYRYGARAFPFTKEKLKQLEDEEKDKHERQTLVNLLTNHSRDDLLANSSLKQATVASLVGKTVGLYFSAQWCLPCLKFTPKLIRVYNNIKQSLVNQQDKDFEIVLVSSDHDQSLFTSYFSTMPWLAVPFGDPTIKTLTKYFDVQGIPCLVIIGPDGKTLSKQGRMLINLHLEKAYPFTQEQLESLEKEMEEEAKSFPRTETHQGHPHQLTLVSQGSGGGPFICCACDEQGSGWAYQCLECGYEVHPRCVKAVNKHDTGS
ncbi:probable nucleoredoxin 2 [Aristolochia californica]|uniref:probable nucleoredoxin 2 n=1 Tax=Aristolochia californica TaxID=171875 RepID=UPI0035E246AC